MFPEFNDLGDLPVGVYESTLTKVIEHFGTANAIRRAIARRLSRINELARQTGHLKRFIIFGSFITATSEPKDVDIFLLMDDDFDPTAVSGESAIIFNNRAAQEFEGASIFWLKSFAALGGEQNAVEDWQHRRDGARRGIIEVIVDDK
jgi:hypothetical protein